MRILIAGTGGVGGYYGARLQGAGHEVWFLARGAGLNALRTGGLRVRSDLGDLSLPSVRAIADGSEAGTVDAALFCVKTYDNRSAAEAMSGAVGSETAICSLQNGVDNEPFLSERFSQAIVLGGVARIEAWVEEPGLVRQRGAQTGLTVGAFRDEHRPSAESLCDAFAGTAVPVRLSEDILRDLWLKLLGICGVGGVTAFCRCTVGEVRSNSRLRSLLFDVYAEVAAVAEARHIGLPLEAPSIALAYVDRELDPALRSSMCRDVERGRPLEIDALNGAIVRMGEELGILTPANETIVRALLPLHMAATAGPR